MGVVAECRGDCTSSTSLWPGRPAGSHDAMPKRLARPWLTCFSFKPSLARVDGVRPGVQCCCAGVGVDSGEMAPAGNERMAGGAWRWSARSKLGSRAWSGVGRGRWPASVAPDSRATKMAICTEIAALWRHLADFEFNADCCLGTSMLTA